MVADVTITLQRDLGSVDPDQLGVAADYLEEAGICEDAVKALRALSQVTEGEPQDLPPGVVCVGGPLSGSGTSRLYAINLQSMALAEPDNDELGGCLVPRELESCLLDVSAGSGVSDPIRRQAVCIGGPMARQEVSSLNRRLDVPVRSAIPAIWDADPPSRLPTMEQHTYTRELFGSVDDGVTMFVSQDLTPMDAIRELLASYARPRSAAPVSRPAESE